MCDITLHPNFQFQNNKKEMKMRDKDEKRK